MARPHDVVFCMGRFRVPRWLFEISPLWLHRLADRFGGVL